MPSNSPSSKLLIGLYTFFMLTGLIGMIFAQTGVVLNSFDLMVTDCWYYVLPIAIVMSYLFIHVIAKHPRLLALKLGLVLFFHALSIICLSWGIFGGMHFMNNMDRYATHHELKGPLIEMYKQEPVVVGLKRDYHRTRYFMSFRDASSQQNYSFEIRDELYESFDYPEISIDIRLNGGSKTKKTREVSIPVKIGILGFIY